MSAWAAKAASEITTKAAPNSPLSRGLTSILEGAIPENFSGVILVAQGNRILINKGFGYSNKDDQIPFNDQTVVDIGSITKQFTAAAILKLELEGKLTTQDQLGKHISSLESHLSTISLHELLTHTSGLTDQTGDDYARLTKENLIEQLNQSPLSFTRGSHHYSNLGYSLLAMVIEKVSGRSYDQYLNEELFRPIGMKQTGYLVPNYALNKVAHGYQGESDWGRPNDKTWQADGPYWNLRGNGGVLSTAQDMLRWHLALHNEKVLPRAALDKLFGMYVREYPGMESFYGYGWVVEAFSDEEKMIWHNGGNGIFSADNRSYPNQDVFYFIAGNQSESQVFDISEKIHATIRKVRKNDLD